MSQKKKIISCKVHVSLLGLQHLPLPHENKQSTFFGVKLLLYNSIRFTPKSRIKVPNVKFSSVNKKKSSRAKAKINWVKFLGYKLYQA
jgi:hypothetical protein